MFFVPYTLDEQQALSLPFKQANKKGPLNEGPFLY